MKRNYECLYIISSAVTEEKRGDLIAKFSKMAGADAKVEKWGMRKFAAPIDYRKEGFYVLMNFMADTSLVGKMSALMNITEGVVRYMFVCKDEKQIKADAVRKVQRAENKAKFAAEGSERSDSGKRAFQPKTEESAPAPALEAKPKPEKKNKENKE